MSVCARTGIKPHEYFEQIKKLSLPIYKCARMISNFNCSHKTNSKIFLDRDPSLFCTLMTLTAWNEHEKNVLIPYYKSSCSTLNWFPSPTNVYMALIFESSWLLLLLLWIVFRLEFSPSFFFFHLPSFLNPFLVYKHSHCLLCYFYVMVS